MKSSELLLTAANFLRRRELVGAGCMSKERATGALHALPMRVAIRSPMVVAACSFGDALTIAYCGSIPESVFAAFAHFTDAKIGVWQAAAERTREECVAMLLLMHGYLTLRGL